MAKPLEINDKSMLYVLQLALEGAIENKEAARENYKKISDAFELTTDNIDAGTAMAIREISDSLEKYLKSADQAVDKLVKIAKLLSDTMIKRDNIDFDISDEDKLSIQDQINSFIGDAKNALKDI